MTSTQTPEPRYCTVYLRPEQQEQQSAQEIKTLLQSKQIEDKIRGLKNLIYAILNDENFDRMTMTVINTLTPLQTDNHNLKKILLYYWEIIEKLNKEGKLRDEMFLVCNSLRSDLLHPNEYLRGRTLRLVSRIMHKGILEPLISSIMEGLNHKHTYVRKNAIIAIYQIFLHFGDSLISDIDAEMEKVLNNENDLSTKRNAFLLLFHTNQQKALDYLYQQILDDRVDDMGDVMQLSVLELFRKTCKQDPTQKQRLMKAILYFQKSKSPSVQFECANTLTQLSNSPNTLRLSTQIYVQILLNNTENNVKMVVLDKLQQILAIEPKFLEEQLVDITKILNTQSFQIRKKAIEIIQVLLNSKNILVVFPLISKEVKKALQEENKEYIKILLDFVEYSVNNFEQIVDEVMVLINENFLTSQKVCQKNQDQIKNILNSLIVNYPQFREKLISKLLERFYDIKSLYIYKGVLWILGEYATGDSTEIALQEIIRSVGPLPIEYIGKPEDDKGQQQGANAAQQPAKEVQKKYKTVILADGTYGTELVVDKQQDQDSNEEYSRLRVIISQNAYTGSVLSRTCLKLILKLKNSIQKFNKFSSQVLLILCSLLRLYTKNQTIYEQDSVEKIHFSIKLLTNPTFFITQKIDWLQNQLKVPKNHRLQQNLLQKQAQLESKKRTIQKQPDDLIVIRVLKSQKLELDLSDDELGEVEMKKQENEDGDFVKKLGKLIQLTGYSDPIYAEAFVHIHKYDIQFETLLINRTSKPLQKVQIDFFTQQSDIKRVIEKAQAVTLQPNGVANVKTSLKFSSSDIGVIFGAINYENIAGIEQAYLITKEIDIDLIDFIYPSEIDLNTFRELWAKYEWENRITLNPSGSDLYQFVNNIREHFKLYLLNDEEEIKNASCICANFYAKTKLDDDFLINLSAEIVNNKINGYARIRSKAKGIVVNLGSKFKM